MCLWNDTETECHRNLFCGLVYLQNVMFSPLLPLLLHSSAGHHSYQSPHCMFNLSDYAAENFDWSLHVAATASGGMCVQNSHHRSNTTDGTLISSNVISNRILFSGPSSYSQLPVMGCWVDKQWEIKGQTCLCTSPVYDHMAYVAKYDKIICTYHCTFHTNNPSSRHTNQKYLIVTKGKD